MLFAGDGREVLAWWSLKLRQELGGRRRLNLPFLC